MAVERIASLLVPSWTEGKGTDGASSHGIIVFLMRLHVLTILNTTVFIVVNVKASNYLARAEGLRDAKSVGKCIEQGNV